MLKETPFKKRLRLSKLMKHIIINCISTQKRCFCLKSKTYNFHLLLLLLLLPLLICYNNFKFVYYFITRYMKLQKLQSTMSHVSTPMKWTKETTIQRLALCLPKIKGTITAFKQFMTSNKVPKTGSS